jgi:hypothetical protein
LCIVGKIQKKIKNMAICQILSIHSEEFDRKTIEEKLFG